jgi:hypothetical protein
LALLDIAPLIANHLSNHWSQPLAALLSRADFMRRFPMFAALAHAGGVSVHSR